MRLSGFRHAVTLSDAHGPAAGVDRAGLESDGRFLSEPGLSDTKATRADIG